MDTKKNPKVDALFSQATRWKLEMKALRRIVLQAGLTEELKWGKPCYTFEESNLVMIFSMKESCGLGFMKGALLKDPDGILLKPGENSQSTRMVKFTGLPRIQELEPVLIRYIKEAIAAEKAGLAVPFADNSKIKFAAELQAALDQSAALKKAFMALTPGRRRAYNIFIAAGKQPQTRLDRIDKYKDRILAGKGMNDCVCGHSKKYPQCDGSHKDYPAA